MNRVKSIEDQLAESMGFSPRVCEEELSRDVKDKIKANNDKMTDLKKNGGSQEEIDALEKENDELNGGNKTSEATTNEAKPLSSEEARLKQEITNLAGEISKTRRKISGAADHRRNEIAKFKRSKRSMSPEEIKKAKEALKRGSETDAEYAKHAKADIAKWREEKAKLTDKFKSMRGTKSESLDEATKEQVANRLEKIKAKIEALKVRISAKKDKHREIKDSTKKAVSKNAIQKMYAQQKKLVQLYKEVKAKGKNAKQKK